MDYKTLLKKQLEANKIHHAYMLSGHYGDKEAVINFFIDLAQVRPEDVLRVSGESISISEVKSLKKELGFAPFNSPYKIAIITPAENLTIEAQNALLKILEEPAKKSVILLFVEDESRILPTIISRCQKVRIPERVEFLAQQPTSIPEDLLQGKLDYQKRFELAEKLSKNMELGTILDGWLVQMRELLLANPKKLKYLELMREIGETRDMLKTNASSRLILESLLLKFGE